VTITINGEIRKIESGDVTVQKLLEINDVKHPDMVSVQLNGDFVGREKFAHTRLKENDEIDFLYFMGGGRFP